MAKNEIKGIIFDMDGVILDSESISDITWNDAAKVFGIMMDIKVLNSCRGSNKNDIIAKLKKIYGSDFDASGFLAKTGEYFSIIEQKNGISLMPYAKEILEYLKSKYILALASSTRKESVYRQLKNAGVFDYFVTITTGDMVKHSKPDPEIYRIACESINLKPEECAAVEDSPNGIKSASAAGLKAIMVPDKIKPTEELKSLIWKICNGLKEVENIL